MSASRVLPSWRPIHDCGQRTDSGPCPQPCTFDDPAGRCFYHAKLAGGTILNGADSRATHGGRGPGNHSGRARPRYDYGTWFDGQPHTLTQNVDFAADMRSMLSMMRRAAVRLGCDIAVTHVGPVITVQTQRAEGAA